jgi:hypothetical protein
MRIFNVIAAGAASTAVLGGVMAFASAPGQAAGPAITAAARLPVLYGIVLK